MFYDFYQNNSGGFYVGDYHYVVVEAPSAAVANKIAETVGVYFNGCATEQDCSCCGDRWSEQWSDDEGTEQPTIWGDPITNRDKCGDVLIVRLDGTKEVY